MTLASPAPADTRFARYFAGTCISFAGNTAHTLSAAVAIITMGGSPAVVPIMMLLSTLTSAVCSVTLAQRFATADPRRVLMAIDAYSVLVIAGLCTAMSLHPGVANILAAEVCLAVGGAAHYPASRAFVRRLLPPDRLLAANSMLGASFQVGNLAGAGAGAVLLAKAGAVTAFAFNGLTFAISLVLLWTTPTGEGATAHPRPAAGGAGTPRAALAAFRTAPGTLPLVAIMLSFLLLQRAFVTLGPAIVGTTLARPPSDFGALQFAFTAGALLGGVLLPRWRRLHRGGVHALFPMTAVSVALFPLAGLLGAVVVLIGAGLSYQGWTVYQTMIQQRLDAVTESRVFGVVGGLQSIALMTVFALSSVAVELLGPSGGLWLTLGAVAAATLPFVWISARRS